MKALSAILAALLAVVLAGCSPPPLHAPSGVGLPIAVSADSISLGPDSPGPDRVGGLVFRGALELASPSAGFGGYSGLAVSPEGKRMLAVSDRGAWLSARLVYDAGGGLAGLAEARLGRLMALDGLPLRGKADSDAESLALMPDGSLLVSFERRHRLLLYPGPFSLQGRPRRLDMPAWLADAPYNNGVEAVASLAGGRILLLAERHGGPGRTLGALGDGRQWRKVFYATSEDFAPTAAAALPWGGLLVLERRYSLSQGVSARLMLVPAADIAPGSTMKGRQVALLAPPLLVDNMEGMAIRKGPQGSALVYLISDDNFSPLQRTLLMMFQLRP